VEWFPLAPNEVYRPAYHASDRYIRRVNITNVNVTNINVTNINVTNINYRNQRVDGAVTAVSQDEFAGSRRIGRGVTIVPVNEARFAHVVGHGAPVAPTEQSVLIRRRDAAPVSRPPEAAQDRQVVWRHTPPPRPATFASHEDLLKSTGDKPVAPLPITETRGAPRSIMTHPVSHTDGPATANNSMDKGAAHTVVPNTEERRVPNVRPNINVHQYPADETKPDDRSGPRTAPNGNENPHDRRVTYVQPSVSARPAPDAKPNVNVRAAPADQPNVNERRPEPRAEPAQAPRAGSGAPANTRPLSHSDVQPNERPANAHSANERPAQDRSAHEHPVKE